MISATNISLAFGQQALFKNVNIKFVPGNCYGIIGANGAGKSTFLNILSGELEPDSGEISTSPNERLAVLRQDQFAFDAHMVLHTVILGHKTLYDIMLEKDAIYEKEDFTEEDGIRAAELEAEFAEMNGWEAEAQAATLLSGLGIPDELHSSHMGELEGGQKVRVLLAQALFGDPDIILLDEPTNNLDLESISWLEDFLYHFDNTVIVVSHDRHFLNRVCTHIADIDFGKIRLFVGNYDFWYQASQLATRQMRDDKKKREDKVSELSEFIQRFSSNASKARQATSRKKLIEKLTIDDIKPSSRKFPYINFQSERECGNNILEIEGITKTIDEELVLDNLSLNIQPKDKIALVGPLHLAKTTLYRILMGETEPDAGSFKWGVTVTSSYFPKENSAYFDTELNLIQWLKQYTEVEEESFVRGFLGRMLFSGEEGFKKVKVLSGGEKVRCMLSRMMQSGANVMIFDEPTNHLDLEAISALNTGLIDFSGVLLFTSHDHQFVDTIANRIIEFTPGGVIDRRMKFDDYLASEDIRTIRDSMYHGHKRLVI
ncbi:MAG: ATP-binding cassette domain-containing protein [Spirochaetales bacterium]|jgi:ATPase subunit of ABC transporter with duplicated ATPase domains|nr:ATP-binding cassette domain-containing protein [Spirochaetales bacterium]